MSKRGVVLETPFYENEAFTIKFLIKPTRRMECILTRVPHWTGQWSIQKSKSSCFWGEWWHHITGDRFLFNAVFFFGKEAGSFAEKKPRADDPSCNLDTEIYSFVSGNIHSRSFLFFPLHGEIIQFDECLFRWVETINSCMYVMCTFTVHIYVLAYTLYLILYHNYIPSTQLTFF